MNRITVKIAIFLILVILGGATTSQEALGSHQSRVDGNVFTTFSSHPTATNKRLLDKEQRVANGIDHGPISERKPIAGYIHRHTAIASNRTSISEFGQVKNSPQPATKHNSLLNGMWSIFEECLSDVMAVIIASIAAYVWRLFKPSKHEEIATTQESGSEDMV